MFWFNLIKVNEEILTEKKLDILQDYFYNELDLFDYNY